jgi:HlyD family secretion protein
MKVKKIVWLVLGVIIILGLLFYNIYSSGGKVNTSVGGHQQVNVKQLRKGEIELRLKAEGLVETEEKKKIYLDSNIKVKNVLVEKYEKVTAGEPLFETDMDEYNSNLDQINLKIASQQLLLKKAALTSSVVAQNDYENAKATYEMAKKSYDRSKVLYETGSISKYELEIEEKSYNDAETAYKNAETELENSETTDKNNEIEREIQKKVLEDLMLSRSILEKSISKLKDAVKSPIDGVVTEVNMESGYVTNSEQPAFVVMNTDNLKIRADIKESDIRYISIGQEVIVTSDLIHKDDGVRGSVEKVIPIAIKKNTSNGDETFMQVIIGIVKKNELLMHGLNVDCEIIASKKSDAIIVSFDMILEDKNGDKYAFVVDKNSNTLKKHTIKLGIISNLKAEVLAGLEENDFVVLEPQPNYKDGDKVVITIMDETE